MHRTLLRGVLKEALEHIPITKNDLNRYYTSEHGRLLSGREDVKTLMYCTIFHIASFQFY